MSVVYNRPGLGSVTIDATPGETNHEIERNGQVIEQFKSRDYIIQVSDLVIAGSNIEPEIGDYITDGSATYDVLRNGSDAQWVYTSPTRQLMRVHTRRG